MIYFGGVFSGRQPKYGKASFFEIYLKYRASFEILVQLYFYLFQAILCSIVDFLNVHMIQPK